MSESVNHPPHYNLGAMEVIDAIDGLNLDFYQGNVLKYVARFRAKGGVEDLKKARWYLDRLITIEAKDADSWRMPRGAPAEPRNGLVGVGDSQHRTCRTAPQIGPVTT